MNMAYEEIKSSGITEETPKNIMLNAATLHRGLTFTDGKWNFDESLFGATSGGTKVSIVPEFTDIPVDGALVKVKGLAIKIGETAKVETNMIELTKDWIKRTVVAKEGTTENTDYEVLESKPQLEDSDYIENFGIIGRLTDGRPVVIVFDYALCTSGLELGSKNKEATVIPATFECYAELSPKADTLPYHIYYPKTVTEE